MDSNQDKDPRDLPSEFTGRSYALSGKIMLSAIVILFFVVVLMVCLHLYARWYLLRARRRYIHRRNRNRPTNLVFYVDPTPAYPAVVSVTRGLDPAVLKSLPLFIFSDKTHPDPVECAVCLSQFEEDESGRVLPKCKHLFHIECIDMWFHSHSTCPLCRSDVESSEVAENPGDIVVAIAEMPVNEPSPIPSLELEFNEAGSLTSSSRLKPISIDIPSRDESGWEDGIDSAASESYRSPMSRMLSFTRILSRDRRAIPSPSPSPSNCGCEAVDIEGGSQESGC